MIPVSIAQVSFSDMGFVVLLKSPQDPRTLPIFIGAPEAQAIAVVLDQVELPRPLTHDLFQTVLDNLKVRINRVEISALRENTFYAKLFLECGELKAEIDSRPSDALALALRCAAPVFVAEEVMDAAGVMLKDESAEAKSKAGGQKPLTAEESLKQQLAKAVEEERFEDAARLRDELKKLANHN
jgi:bifunctional DNase/RNase